MLQNNLTVAAATTTITTTTSSPTSAIAAISALQPKIVVIRRRPNQGYGFTLRHFIAYPPEDDDNDDDDDDATWPQEAAEPTTSTSCSTINNDTTTTTLPVRKKQQVKAMETIFIKEVHPNGPAHYANLQTGDRVLMVNNQPIAGIAYSTIVSMIKQTPSVLTLHVVPKECDVLQMHYTSIAHTPESNRSSATAANMASFQQTAALVVAGGGGGGGGGGGVGYGNGSTGITTKSTMAGSTNTTAAAAKSFSSISVQHQQQLISYQPPNNNRLISGANNLRSIEYNDVLHQQHIHHQQQQQQQQHYQQQQSALVLRGESGFTLRSNATPPNATVLTRQQQQQQQHQQLATIYAPTAETNDLMIRLRESIKQKEEFLKSPLPHAHHTHNPQQQQQQQHFFPSHTPPTGSPQLSMVSSSTNSVSTTGNAAAGGGNGVCSARGQVRTKQPLSASSSTASSTRELLPASYDLHNFYTKTLSFDSMMNRNSNGSATGGLVGGGGENIMKNSTGAYAALSTRLQQRQSTINIYNGKYPKELDYMETLQETGGVTNKVFESKLVSHLAKGFDPFKPLSIQTTSGTANVSSANQTATTSSNMLEGPKIATTATTTTTTSTATTTNTNNIVLNKKSSVLYESLHQHPLHQMQLQQHIKYPKNNINNNYNNNNKNINNNNGNHVIDGQPSSRMELHKASVATIDTSNTMAESNKQILSNIVEGSTAGFKTSADSVVVRRLKPISSLDDANKPMRRISYLRATNNETEYQSDTSSINTTATMATSGTSNSSPSATASTSTMITTSEQIEEDALDLDTDTDPLYDVVAGDQVNEMTSSTASEKIKTPDSINKLGIRRSSCSSDIRNSVHTDLIISEFETFETKDVATEMEIFETEMEIKASSINGKRMREFSSWRQAKIEIKGDILTIHSNRHTKSENNVIELDIRNLLIYDESADKKKYIFRIQSKPLLFFDDMPDKLTSSGSSSSASVIQGVHIEHHQHLQQQQHPYTDILFKTKSITEMKRIFGLLQWKNSLIFEDSDLQGKQLAEPQKTVASASMPTATYCDDNVQQQQIDYSPRGVGDIETSDSISPVLKPRKSSSHKNIPDKDLGSPKAKNWKDLLFRRGGGSSNSSGADISPSTLAATTRTTGSIGVPLKLCPMSKSNEYVPNIVDVCTQIVESKGLGVVGIYRIPGNKAAISELSEQVNKQDFSWDRCNTDVRWEDVNVVSSLLKLFIRSLPDALLPTSFYNLFIEADKKSGLLRLKELKDLLESLPRNSYETMKHLIRHLNRISKNCEVNLMEPKNLAIIFGPSIIRTPNDTLEIAVKDMKHQCRIVELLLTQYDYFFENGITPDVADICGNGPSVNCTVAATAAAAQSQENQTNMLLHNVSKIERLTERETTRTSRFIPALRRRTHNKRSAVSSDTYSGESVLSLDYGHTKTAASASPVAAAASATTIAAATTASSSSSSSTNITTALSSSGGTQARSTATTILNISNISTTSSSKKKERSFLGYGTRAHYRKASLDEKDSVGSGSNSGSSIGKREQRSSVDISILLTDDEESSNSRISDTGSMSLTTITDTLDSKLRNLRSGSESNDENCSPEFSKNRRHTLGQPLHLHSENIPYADESPERHFHAAHPLDVTMPKSHMLSRTCTADAKAVLERNLGEKPTRSLLTPGALTYKNHKLQHSATVPINCTVGIGSSPVAASTPTALKITTNMGVASGNSISGTSRNSYIGKNLRFSSSVYEHCCSEDDSEGSTTSDPKESSLIINSPSYLLDRYNKKRRDHRLFRSASFNCRNYSTRHNHAHMHSGNACAGVGGVNNSNCGTPTTAGGLTKDEKTDMNLTKKRQIQNKQNRSIKRRHTVGGPHDYANNATTPTGNKNSAVNSTSNGHAHKNSNALARRMPLGNANGNINNGNNNNNNNNNNNINNASSDNGNSSAGSSGAGDGVDGSSSGVSSGGNEVSNATTRATVAVAAPGGDHVLEVGIRIKNLNRGRY